MWLHFGTKLPRRVFGAHVIKASWPRPRNLEPNINHMLFNMAADQDLWLQDFEPTLPRRVCGSHFIGGEVAMP